MDRIKILFFGSDWDVVEHYVIGPDAVEKNIVRNTDKGMTGTEGSGDRTIAVAELHGFRGNDRVIGHVSELLSRDDLCCCYFVLEDSGILPLIRAEAGRQKLNDIELYGIDPDYFYSIVPLTGDHHRKAERYIQGLKDDPSMKSAIKKIIKDVLIVMDLSKYIYEMFVVSVKGKAGRSQAIL